MAPKIELFYFDFKGRAEPIRLALSVAGLEFTDTRFAREDWPTRKSEFPAEVVPAIKIDGKVYGQTQAILKWAGSQNNCGLYPQDSTKALLVDQATGCMDDISGKFKYGLAEDEMKESRATFSAAAQKSYAFLEAKMTEHGGKYLCGDEMSIADIQSLVVIDWIESGTLDHVDKDLFKAYPKVQSAKKLTESHAAIAAWNKKTA
eukprot:Filipodium_phascolosomae@DN2654_c0_g1_i1.p1